ncbi:MAG: response regulator [Deltaproteobacteria bacterium]|nr:response regulator [Deltaproteobacteria bacterium]
MPTGQPQEPKRQRLLVVDDDPDVRETLADGLRFFGYDVQTAGDASEAYASALRESVQLVLSDIRMPDEDGMSLMARLKALDPDVEVVLVTGIRDMELALQAMRKGATDYLTKPFRLEEVRFVVDRALEKQRLVLENREWQAQLERLVQERTRELSEKKAEVERLYDDLEKTWESTLHALLLALDLRDNETRGHSWRVVEYAVLLARALAVDEATIPDIRLGAIFHDIGKIGVPDSILRKPSTLDEAEWAMMRRHPDMGYQLLASVGFPDVALGIVHAHEERWDGSGYPRGLEGDQIPLGARIFAVVDTFDSMTSDRPYRPACGIAEARAEIRRVAGVQFDPRVAAAFLSIPAVALEAVRDRVHAEALAIEEQVQRTLDPTTP